MNLERPGQPSLRRSTKIPVAGATPEQTKINKQLAEAVYNAGMGDLARGAHGLDEGRPTISFQTFADWYLEHHTEHKRCARTERYVIQMFRAWFGARLLHTIDTAAIAEWRTARRRKVKATTVNREVDILRHLLRTATPKYLAANPATALARLHGVSARVRLLTEDEERRILDGGTLLERALLLLGLDTLVRLGDLARLRWRDDHGSYVDIVHPKVAPYRVPVTARLRLALDALPRTSAYVFPRPRRPARDRPRSADGLAKVFRRLCTRHDVPHGRAEGGVTFHSLRHTGASRALDRGASVRAVQELGGWNSIRQLERYAHPSWAAVQAAADQIGARPMHTPDQADAQSTEPTEVSEK